MGIPRDMRSGLVLVLLSSLQMRRTYLFNHKIEHFAMLSFPFRPPISKKKTAVSESKSTFMYDITKISILYPAKAQLEFETTPNLIDTEGLFQPLDFA